MSHLNAFLATVKPPEQEVLALAESESEIEDVCVPLHGEHCDHSVSAFRFPSLQCKIDWVQLSVARIFFVRSTSPLCTSPNHMAVAPQVGPLQEPSL